MRHAPTSPWARCVRRSATSGAPGARRPSSERLTSAQQSRPTDRPGCSSTLPTGMSADPFESVFEHRDRARKPGWRKALPWILGIVAVGAIVAIVIAVLPSSKGHQNAALTPNVPAKIVSQVPKTVKLEPGAEKVARRFIQTAVARKHMREAYKLAGPQIIQGQSLKSWLTGNIAVIPFPVDKVAL